MIELVVSHLWTVVSSGPPEELALLVDSITVANPAAFQARRRGSHVASHISFFMKGNLFPTGLVPWVTRVLQRKGVEVVITKTNVSPMPVVMQPSSDMFEGITLNDEQMSAIHALVNAPHPRGYLKAHPGFGKTEVIFAVYACFRPSLTLLLVTRSGLREQAMERCMKRLGETPYVIGKSKGPLPTKGLIISTYHTLYNKLVGKKPDKNGKALKSCEETKAAMAKVKMVLVDECHRTGGRSLSECLKRVSADRRYGFSATPLKSNNAVRNMMLRSWVGEELHNVPRQKQIDAGRLARVHVFLRDMGKDAPLDLPEMLGYNAAFMEAYMDYKPFLRQVVEDILWFYKNGRPCLVLVDWKYPGEKFHGVLSRLVPKHEVAFVHGDIPAKQRTTIKAAFGQGKIKIVVATPVFNEGEDLPSAAGLVMACPGRDTGALYQKVGRGIRPKKEWGNTLAMTVYFNRRHRYFIGHAREQLKYFASNTDLYTMHLNESLEVLHGLATRS